jgi:hypothetical protein
MAAGSNDPRYLTYTPWQGQLNNTRICFETALLFAYIKGRILVLPAGYRHRDQPEWQDDEFRPLHPGEFLDIEHLATIVPMIPHQEYAEDTTDRRQYDVVDISIAPGAAVFCYPQIPAAGTADAERLGEFAAGRRVFLQSTPDIDDCRTLNIQSPTLEPFYAFFYFSNLAHELECKRLVRDHVRFRPYILEAGRQIAAYLGTYAALHVRRGDFFWQYPEQDVTPEQILQSMDRVGVPPARLYIASDEMNRGFFAPISQRYETYFIDHFIGSLGSELSGEDIACIEQVVCSYADVFLGTRLSTFSSYITRLRGYWRALDQAVHFTDGSPGSEADDHGSPGFSWVNWLRRGNPLWGREYREGWNF